MKQKRGFIRLVSTVVLTLVVLLSLAGCQSEETTDEDFYNDLRKFIIGEEKEITVETNGEEQEVSTVTYLRKCIN